MSRFWFSNRSNIHKSKGRIMKYANVKNEMGTFKMVDKTLIDVPTNPKMVQRLKRDPNLLKDMAANWDWACAGTITLVPKGKRYVALDGGTRTLAAKTLNGSIPKLPCMIYNLKTQKRKANAFLGMNKNRRNIGAIDNHRIEVMAEKEIAMKADRIVKESGYEVNYSNNANSFQAIGTLHKMVKTNPVVAYDAFYLCSDIAKGKPILGQVLRGIFELERALKKDIKRMSVFSDKNRKKLVDISMRGILQEINNQKFLSAKGSYTPVVCARGVAEVINKGRRSGKLNPRF